MPLFGHYVNPTDQTDSLGTDDIHPIAASETQTSQGSNYQRTFRFIITRSDSADFQYDVTDYDTGGTFPSPPSQSLGPRTFCETQLQAVGDFFASRASTNASASASASGRQTTMTVGTLGGLVMMFNDAQGPEGLLQLEAPVSPSSSGSGSLVALGAPIGNVFEVVVMQRVAETREYQN